ncbi:MAG: diacylglycerol kinase family protein [Pseudomonadota bacterium]
MPAEEVHLFLNPTAGRGRAGKRQARILELLAASTAKIIIHNSSAVGDLENQVAAAVKSGARRLVVAGGDGSIHEAVNGIFAAGKDAALGVIPTGTGNDFAKACDIPLDWEHATRLLADRLREQVTARRVDIGRCNDRYFANGAGIGFDAKATRVARSIRLPIGDIVYLIAIVRAMSDGVATPNMRITGDEFQWHGPVTLANIANGPWVGGMFHIAPAASNADGEFDLVIAKPVTRRRILGLLPKLMKGTHVDEDEVVVHRVRRLQVATDEVMPSHLDGEVQPLQSEFDVELLPGALRLL